MTLDAGGGGDSRLRGNDGVGAGMTGGVEMVGRGDENGGTQRRRGAMKSRGDSRLHGNDVGGRRE